MPDTVYALEQIPALIGERQYKMLCEALGWKHLPFQTPTPEQFAGMVQTKSEKFKADRLVAAEQEERELSGALQPAS